MLAFVPMVLNPAVRTPQDLVAGFKPRGVVASWFYVFPLVKLASFKPTRYFVDLRKTTWFCQLGPNLWENPPLRLNLWQTRENREILLVFESKLTLRSNL